MKILLHTIVIALLLSCGRKEESREVLPASIPPFEVSDRYMDLFEGFIQIRKITDPGAQMIINASGEVIWYQVADTALFRPFTPKKDRYLALFSEKVLHEIKYAGDTLLKLTYGQNGFDRPLHHDLIYDGNNIAALTKEKYPVDLKSLGGDVQDTITTDGILVLDRNGNKIWHWQVTDVLDPREDENVLKTKNDWGHANSLAIDEDGHFLISWRNFNEVWKINRSSGKIIWRYGHKQVRDSSEMFYGQHTFHLGANGEYLLFDNGNKSNRRSRAVGFSYSEVNGFEQTLSIPLPDSLITSKQGSVFQIDNDRYLFSSSMSSSLLVTDATGKLLWYAKSNVPYYRAYYLEDVIF